MIRLSLILRGPEQSVRSLAVQAQAATPIEQPTVFEALTRHLLDRLVHNEALGEEIPTRVLQLAYMFALPGVLMALYLFAAYHQPHAIGPRPFWLQISDHYVYSMYAFVVLGAVTVFEWDLLFPDLLDVFVLTSLPIGRRQLLSARLLALAIFLTLVLLSTNILGTLFFPAVADLRGMWWRHVSAHFATVAMAGAFAAALFIALQGSLLCVLGRKLFGWISPAVQAISIVALLTILFLTPLLCIHLRPLLESSSIAVRLFPPFWFLGLYERLLWGSAVLPLFVPLAATAVLSTIAALTLAVLTYPLAYTRRTRQLVEGNPILKREFGFFALFHPLLHATILRSPQQRAIYHFIGQTLLRTSRLRLYLSLYAGAALSLALSSILLLKIGPGHIHFGLSTWGIRTVVPIFAFLLPIGIRTALNAPIGMNGGWIFLLIHGKPLPEHLQGVHRWGILAVGLVTTSSLCVLHFITPAAQRSTTSFVTQLLLGLGLTVLLTDLFFLRFYGIPFTTTRRPSTTDLPVSFVRYSVLLPLFVLWVVNWEQWSEVSLRHLGITIFLLLGSHGALRSIAHLYTQRIETDASFSENLSGSRLGLQE
ncbi:hypothetical protein [Edaphobacter modestus]|uniref:ABC-2 type transport system permease protein n=1 Tax=Edaphobacter modestus TaxID=388466 RepID=A0A4Q7YSV6_9BACT|nr:hypothetical protein [Edaphobacter modestus]RZU40053.1 hypothetical protein BDD14_1476 [Edaphobacter modestus]